MNVYRRTFGHPHRVVKRGVALALLVCATNCLSACDGHPTYIEQQAAICKARGGTPVTYTKEFTLTPAEGVQCDE